MGSAIVTALIAAGASVIGAGFSFLAIWLQVRQKRQASKPNFDPSVGYKSFTDQLQEEVDRERKRREQAEQMIDDLRLQLRIAQQDKQLAERQTNRLERKYESEQ